MKDLRVSIIVPVYNTECYVADCINSILAQTYPFWELIVVDDGSSDASGSICDDYAEKDRRIQCYHQENQGVSSARNLGIQCAKGGFVDSDDMITPRLLETAVTYMKEENLDLLYFNLDMIVEKKEGKEPLTVWEPKNKIESFQLSGSKERVAYILDEYLEFNACYFLCNKFFRLNLVKAKGIYFESGVRMGEDIGFLIQYLLYAHKVKGISEVLSWYRIRYGSAMNKDNTKIFWLDDFVSLLKGVWRHRKKAGISCGSFNTIFMKVMDNQYQKRESRREYRDAVKQLERKNRPFFIWQTCEALLHPFRFIRAFGKSMGKRKWKDNLFALGYLILPGKAERKA